MTIRSPRFALAALTTTVVALTLSSCTAIERSIVSGKVEDAFNATFTPGTELTDLGDGLWTYRWLTYRTLVWRSADGLVLFDPLNRSAVRDLEARMREAAPGRPIVQVVYSHAHRDHSSGADALSAPAARLAHAEVVRELEQRAYADVAAPTERFEDDDHALRAEPGAPRLIRVAGAHTDGLTVTYFPARRLLYAVDLVWPGQLPPPGAPMSFSGTERALDTLLALDFDTFVPGHGPVADRAAVARYRQFLSDLRAEFLAALGRRGLSDLHALGTFESAPAELGGVFFEVIDALEGRYGDWANYHEAMLATVQWCFWSVLTGD